MPIYAYRCSACGHEQDVLQKLSDPLLTRCPACGRESYEKQVTAAGFQLKGTGWYATDFRNQGKPKAPPASQAAGGDAAPATGSAAPRSDGTPASSAASTSPG